MTRTFPNTVALLLVPIFMLPSDGAAMQGTPTPWQLSSEPRVEIGLDGVELHQVRAAASLGDDRIVVADAGNTRILVLSPAGELLLAFGSQGDGPTEFRAVSDMAATEGDTLVVYDGLAGRTSVWLPDGTHVGTRRLPQVGGMSTWFVDALSASAYLATRYEHPSGEDLSLLGTPLLKVDATSDDVETLGSWAWRYVYRYTTEGGVTAYDAPFFGQTRFVAVGSAICVVPLGGLTVLVLEANGSIRAEVPLPTSLRPFDRRRLEAHRDSLLDRTSERFPFQEEQLRAVFGDEFPVPEHDPSIAEAVAVGDQLWLKVVPELGATTARWYVVDPDEGSVPAQLRIPSEWKVLGGDRDGVLILRRTDFDVEVLGVYPVDKVPA